MKPQRILVVDDDRFIRAYLSMALGSAGYDVETASDAEEALDLLKNGHRASDPFDFLLTDFNLPCLTGLDLLDALQEEGIELPALLMSGDLDETLELETQARGCVGCLQKPFLLPALMEHLHGTLGEQLERTG